VKLGQKFAREILNGKAPALTDEPELEQGQLVDLHDIVPFEVQPHQVTIRISGFTKGGRWSYVLRDHRPTLLGRQSGYTDRPDRAIKARGSEYEPESVTGEVQRELTMRGRARRAERQQAERSEDQARRDARRVANELRQLAISVARAGGDPVELLAQFERQIRELQCELDEGS
jgi:hypothetical protein